MQMNHVFELSAPRERVFEYLSSPEKMKQWAQGVEETKYSSGAPGQAGARFQQSIREGGRVNTYDGEVLAAEPPTHLRVRMRRGNFSITMDHRLSDLPGDKTRLEQTMEFESGSAFGRLIGRLFAPMTRSMMRKQVTQFKALVEQGR